MLNLTKIAQTTNLKIGTVLDVDFENLLSPNGNMVPNQFALYVTGDEGSLKVFKSYRSIIAIKTKDSLIFDENKWDYSMTTLKYLKQFLGKSIPKKELVKMIDNGEILLADLNV